MAVLRRAFIERDVSLRPGEVPLARFLAQDRLLVADSFGDDAAPREIVLVHQDESTGHFEISIGIEGDRILRPDGELSHLIPAHAFLLGTGVQIGGINNAMDNRDLAFHFTSGQTQEIFFADLQRALAEPK